MERVDCICTALNYYVPEVGQCCDSIEQRLLTPLLSGAIGGRHLIASLQTHEEEQSLLKYLQPAEPGTEEGYEEVEDEKEEDADMSLV